MEDLDLMDKLIDDVKKMTVEEYLVFHEEALIMKTRYDDMVKKLSAYEYETFNLKSRYSSVSIKLNDTCIESKYREFSIKNKNSKDENIWELVA